MSEDKKSLRERQTMAAAMFGESFTDPDTEEVNAHPVFAYKQSCIDGDERVDKFIERRLEILANCCEESATEQDRLVYSAAIVNLGEIRNALARGDHYDEA